MLVRHLYHRTVQMQVQQRIARLDDLLPKRTPSHLQGVQRHAVQQAGNAHWMRKKEVECASGRKYPKDTSSQSVTDTDASS